MRLFDTLAEPLRRSAQVNTLYGDPITASGKTIIPIARIGYGFGVSADSETETEEDETEEELALGGGGGVAAVPVGVLEVTDKATRFIPLRNRRRLVAAFLVGTAVGYWLSRRQATLLIG
jgi:uncharacterized spore protein YtfJ